MSKALYQKYRPTTFDNVLEQSHVVSVLDKAVKSKSPAHAYLFTGSKGIGKTSIARIFAKALKTNDIDIFEIDAASHTSVDHMREITESVYSQPVQSKYKIYILDEVHMLSKSAFNAFLKTLEEPPEYAIFILVTTESNKIPETVASRCIEIEFYIPSLMVLKDAVINVAKKEGFTINEESAILIALLSEGSFRDALTLLQKVLVVSGSKKVEQAVVEEILGAPKHELVNSYLNALVKGNVGKGLEVLNKMSHTNANIELFAKLCIQKIRASLLVREGMHNLLEDYSEENADFIRLLSKEEVITVETLKGLIDVSYSISQSYIRILPLELFLIQQKDNLTSK